MAPLTTARTPATLPAAGPSAARLEAARRIVAPVTGQFVSCIKDSSLLSVISLRELTKAAEVINASTYRTFETYLPLALLYLLLTWPLSHLTRRLERGIRNGMRETPR